MKQGAIEWLVVEFIREPCVVAVGHGVVSGPHAIALRRRVAHQRCTSPDRANAVTLRAGYPVWTSNPVTGRGVPGAPMLDLSGRQRVPTKIVHMRHPWHPRHPIISLRRTCAESERGGAHCTGDRGCRHDFLDTHSWSPFCPSPLPQMSGTALAR